MKASSELAACEADTGRPCRIHLDEDAVVLTACDDEAAVLRTLQFSQLIAATLASGTGTDYTLELRDTYGGGVTAVVESPGDESIARDLLDRIVAHALQTRKAPFQLITACHAPELAGSGVADHAMHPGLGF